MVIWMLVDFQHIAEISYLVENGATLYLSNGFVVDIENIGEYIQNIYDA